jgi:hypothetical protein
MGPTPLYRCGKPYRRERSTARSGTVARAASTHGAAGERAGHNVLAAAGRRESLVAWAALIDDDTLHVDIHDTLMPFATANDEIAAHR